MKLGGVSSSHVTWDCNPAYNTVSIYLGDTIH